LNHREYEKLQTVFKRDPETNHKTLLEGEFSRPEFFTLRDIEWTFTEKVDGTNIRLVHDADGGITYHGRKNASQVPPALGAYLEWFIGERKERFWSAFTGKYVVLYGEGFGAGIQKGGDRYADAPSFVLFDVNVGGVYLERCDVEKIATDLDLPVVPIVGRGTLGDLVKTVKIDSMKSAWGDFTAEGLVAKPSTELCNRFGNRIITKLKCSDYR